MSKEFKRQESGRHSKLGRNRRKLQKWGKPKGRDSKMRLKRKGYPKVVSIGFKNSRTKKPSLISNLMDLSKVSKDSTVILARIGAKKKFELIKTAQERGIKIINVKGETKK
jgi:large subunit ribosomal protein L32e